VPPFLIFPYQCAAAVGCLQQIAEALWSLSSGCGVVSGPGLAAGRPGPRPGDGIFGFGRLAAGTTSRKTPLFTGGLYILKGLILAQNERWRRGLGMQVAGIPSNGGNRRKGQ
jgi:hypothetical protein